MATQDDRPQSEPGAQTGARSGAAGSWLRDRRPRRASFPPAGRRPAIPGQGKPNRLRRRRQSRAGRGWRPAPAGPLPSSWGPTPAPEAPQNQTATGASSGSGRVIAETLASKGYFVYAGARKQEDLDALDAIDNIKAIRLDVTTGTTPDGTHTGTFTTTPSGGAPVVTVPSMGPNY